MDVVNKWKRNDEILQQARSQTFLWGGGGQIGQILGPFMINGGLSCDRVEFGHFGGGQMTPPDPPLATGLFSHKMHNVAKEIITINKEKLHMES